MVEEIGDEPTRIRYEHNFHKFAQDCAALRPALLSLAKHLCGGKFVSDVEDLVQAALVKAIDSRHSFEPGTNLKAWVSTILRNHFFNYKRSLSRRIPAEVDIDQLVDSNTLQQDLDSRKPHSVIFDTQIRVLALNCEIALQNGTTLDFEEIDDGIQRVLEGCVGTQFIEQYLEVNLRWRTVFALVDVLEFSYEDVASILGIPLGTVMSQIFRARNSLLSNPVILDMGLDLHGLVPKIGEKRNKRGNGRRHTVEKFAISPNPS
jgi:RNA polymerase sigma-70 factor (ECF subfamily)